MEPVIVLLAAGIGYLFGAISFTRVVGNKVASGADLTSIVLPTTSEEEQFRGTFVSATTLSVNVGAKAGMSAALLDMLKVFIPTLAFRLLFPEQPYFLIVAVTGVIGHCWPIYYGFKGGRGLSAIYGGMLAIDPIGAIVTAFLGLFLGMLLREAYITYVGGMIADRPLVVAAHGRLAIRRLWRGDQSYLPPGEHSRIFASIWITRSGVSV